MSKAPWEINKAMFLSVEECHALLAHIRGLDRGAVATFLDRLIIETMLFTGLRNSEFCRLRLGDAGLTTSRPSLTIAGEHEQREVYLPHHVRDLVKNYVAKFRADLLPAGIRPDEAAQPLIFHERRRPFERTGLYRRVVRILTEAGLEDRASVQLLRHTYGYLAYLRTGGNLLFVQRQLGHAHPMITSIYAQFVDESYAELAERVALPAEQEIKSGVKSDQPETSPQWTNTVEEFQSEFD